MAQYKLMVKIHNITGLKYLCITKRKNWQKYLGSGRYWRNHLISHGKDIRTELLYESDDYSEFLKMCYFYSDHYDVAKSDKFANAIPEHGYETDRPGVNNFELFWQNLSDEDRDKLLTERAEKVRIGLANMSEEVDATRRENISKTRKEMYSKMTLDEKLEMMKNFHLGLAKFFSDKTSPEFISWTEKLSIASSARFSSMSEEELAEHGAKITAGRNAMSEEAKALRASRVSEAFKTSEKRHAFNKRMSVDRVGAGNPSAKIVVWEGKRYTIKELHAYAKQNNIPRSQIYSVLDSGERSDCYRDYVEKIRTYDVVVCPHCNTSSHPNKQPSTFKRWHLDNCKHRKIEND